MFHAVLVEASAAFAKTFRALPSAGMRLLSGSSRMLLNVAASVILTFPRLVSRIGCTARRSSLSKKRPGFLPMQHLSARRSGSECDQVLQLKSYLREASLLAGRRKAQSALTSGRQNGLDSRAGADCTCIRDLSFSFHLHHDAPLREANNRGVTAQSLAFAIAVQKQTEAAVMDFEIGESPVGVLHSSGPAYLTSITWSQAQEMLVGQLRVRWLLVLSLLQQSSEQRYCLNFLDIASAIMPTVLMEHVMVDCRWTRSVKRPGVASSMR